MKIAILACLKANDVCAGVACLDALEQRRAYFRNMPVSRFSCVHFSGAVNAAQSSRTIRG